MIHKNTSYIFKRVLTSFICLLFVIISNINAQEFRVVDNKGTINTVRNNTVTSGIAPINPLDNDIWFDTTDNIIRVWEADDTDPTMGRWLDLTFTGTQGSVFFAGADGSPTEDNDDLFFDDVNHRFYVGNSSLTGTNTLNVGGTTRTSGLNNSNGSANQPSYRFTNDSSSGMYSPAVGQLAFSTNNTNAISIASNQNITIHSLPDAGTETVEIVVADSNGVLKKVDFSSTEHTGTTGSVFFADTDGTPTEDNDQLFWDDTNDRLGIGTNTPESSLHIVAPNTPNDSGALKITGIDPDIILDDTNGGNNTLTYKTNGDNRALVGTIDTTDDFFISIVNSTTNGFDNDAFTIRNDNSFIGIGVAQSNSNLQVIGSISKSIQKTTAALTLDATDYAIIITDATHNVLLPTPDATNTGREYIIKNTTTSNATSSTYKNTSGTDTTVIPANNVLKVQSFDNEWHQMNNYSTPAPMVIDIVADYTLTAEDNGNIITFPGDADYTLTIPAGLSKGFNISLYQKDDGVINNGNVTIVNGTAATIINRLDRFITAGDGAGVGIVALEDDVFYITGDLKKM